MNAPDLYEYAVLRYVPDIERGEFVNIGLLMMCKRRRWIRSRLHLEPGRLAGLRLPHPLADILRHAEEFMAICSPEPPDGHPLCALPVEERFRWLTAVKSSCLATSRPHAGHTRDLDGTFDCLFRRLVQ